MTCTLGLVQAAAGLGQNDVGPGVVRRPFQSLLQMFDRFAGALALIEQSRQFQMGGRRVRIESQCLSVMGFGRLHLAQLKTHVGQMQLSFGIARIDCRQRSFVLVGSLLESDGDRTKNLAKLL